MAGGSPSISAETLVDDAIDHDPRVARVFLRHGMQCVGCPVARFETLAEACRIYRQPLDGFLAEIAAAVRQDTRRPDGSGQDTGGARLAGA